MVAYHLVIEKRALEFISLLPLKSKRIVIEKCKTLADDPFPGQGDKELIHRKGHKDIYRLHISRSYTAFYRINKEEKMVKILEITTIEQAHKIYGRF
ncbi:MAG: type II toxin-antitoxin system RelE/ParE family toxin [Methanothrix sp.]|nr:type II toxin-antitoxin system RelE/ParE family toxin [Methanothrix sp.]MDD4447865.1 type II toxin-antitoxin system RelE/ParE family toxin [Methanothrix sp.]